MKKILIFLFFVFLINSSFVFSYLQNGNINLLAVTEDSDNKTSGSLANLFLNIKPGVGRIFIDSYPYTKLDTQFTTRYAKKFACNYLGIDCSKYDFFYTIRAGSTIIGGPSAGAATALLTVAMLDNRYIPKDIAVTGTIGSGGIIGAVGGIKEKVEISKKSDLKKVFIPKYSFNKNLSINLTGIQTIRVSTFDELYNEIFDVEIGKDHKEIIEKKIYTNVMRNISENLCKDAKDTIKKIVSDKNELINNTLYNRSMQLYKKSFNESVQKDYYSSASYCFGALSGFLKISMSNISNDDFFFKLKEFYNNYNDIRSWTQNHKIKSFTDLQAYMITMMRITEAKSIIEDMNINSSKIDVSSYHISNLAFAIARLKSAKYWSFFFNKVENPEFEFSDEALKSSCIQKLSEVEGYLNYFDNYLGIPLKSIRDQLGFAYKDYYEDRYSLCLFKATKAHSDTEIILLSLNINPEDYSDLLNEKEKIARNVLGKNIENGIFPILAYSYYTYAKSLKETDKTSSLLYYEYASNMGDMTIYFEKNEDEKYKLFKYIPREYYYLFFLGIIIGSSFTILIFLIFGKKFKKVKTHKKLRKYR